MTLTEFWRTAPLLSRIALLTAGASAAANLGSYAGLTMRGSGAPLALLHLAVMGLLFALFVRTAYRNWRGRRAGSWDPFAPRRPWCARLVVATVLAIGYALAVAVQQIATFGEGGADVVGGRDVWVGPRGAMRALAPGELAAYTAAELRLFSAFWLFIALIVAVAAERVEGGIRASRSTVRRAAT